MKRSTTAAGILLLWLSVGSLQAAPLFPLEASPGDERLLRSWIWLATVDVSERPGCARPLQDCKRDRAATRWELALMVAQLLQTEQSDPSALTLVPSGLALSAEARDELKTLTKLLAPELTSLGVRVDGLEAKLEQLQQRVDQSWTFYGTFTTRASSYNLTNRGLGEAGLVRGGNNAPNVLINYNSAVGSALGAGGAFPAGGLGLPNFNPFGFGVLSTTNWANGRPFVNGTGFSSRLLLGTKGRLSKELEAGLELTAYTSQGNSIIDAYYGVSAPYLSNPFTASVARANRPDSFHQPATQMNLERFWLVHLPSQTKVTLGSFSDTQFSPSVFAGMVNPNLYGPYFLENYGAQVRGQSALNDDLRLAWEVMFTRLPDGNAGALPNTPGFGQSYYSHCEGLNLQLSFDEGHGRIKLNGLRASNDFLSGQPSLGLIQSPNLTLGWVNPNGYYGRQLGFASMDGIGSAVDSRPVAMNVFGNGFQPDGSIAALGQVGPNFGGIGPQLQTSWGVTADYRWPTALAPRVAVQWAQSHYQPSKTSGFSSDGQAWLASTGISLADKTLDIDLTYLSVDANYDPFIISMPSVGGIGQVLWRTPDFNYFNSLYSLHDTREAPHNRQGLRAKLQWKPTEVTRLNLDYFNLGQRRSSLQDVRYSPGSIANNTPNTAVLGQLPGTIEPVFGGYHPATFVSDGNNLLAFPLEDPKGRVVSYTATLQQRWDAWTVTGNARLFQLHRPSQLSSLVAGPAGLRGEDVNHVDLNNVGWRIGLEYQVTPTFKAKANYGGVNIYGHYDPAGTYTAHAERVGNGKFLNVDVSQYWPEVGFNWQLSDNVNWGLEGRYYTMTDHVDGSVVARPAVGPLNINSGNNAALYQLHPFNWQALQISTEFTVKF